MIANAANGKVYDLNKIGLDTLVDQSSDTFVQTGGNLTVDNDEDGLPDTMEIKGIPLNNGEIITTDPEKTDTDNDGLKDGEELVEFVGPVKPGCQRTYHMNSDPTKQDSDGDNCSDSYEINVSKTDPMQDDTDGDGAIDSRDCKPLVYSEILYNREAAYIYSQLFYDNYNSYYPRMKKGDCANFVSQCIFAGGLEMNEEWHMIKRSIFEKINPEPGNLWFSWTKTWTMANEQYHYFKDNYGVKTYKLYPDDSISEFVSNHNIQKGDLLYFNETYESEDQDVHHASIISAVKNGDIYYAAHTDSYDKKSLKGKIVEVYPNGEHKGERKFNYVYIIQMSDAL